jgi:tRNA(Arg) A34 adenosine deaminase TadA
MCNHATEVPAHDVLRRRLVGGIILAGGLALVPVAHAAAQGIEPRTRQSLVERAFAMRELALKAGDQAYGAVVARGGQIIAESPSRVVTNNDPTAHAEMEAIRAAARRLGSRDLAGCDLYGSSAACPMCEAAAYWANIGRMIHGTTATDAGPPRLGRT